MQKFDILTLESIFLVLYSIECLFKVLGLGLIFNKGAYLRDSWNILDFIILISAYSSLLLDMSGSGGKSGFNIVGLRSLRVLRPLRTISSIKNLKVLMKTLFGSIPLLL